MIDVNIVAHKTLSLSGHVIRAKLNGFSFFIKFDTGAKHTVISSDVFHGKISDSKRDNLAKKLDAMNINSNEFVSASGDRFKGYLVKSKTITLDKCNIHDFYYYLIVKNNRIIALLGEDFIDNCKFTHEPNDDIYITRFNEGTYYSELEEYIDEENLVELIDEIE